MGQHTDFYMHVRGVDQLQAKASDRRETGSALRKAFISNATLWTAMYANTSAVQLWTASAAPEKHSESRETSSSSTLGIKTLTS